MATNPGVGEAAANRRATESELRQQQSTLLPQVRVEARAGPEKFNQQIVPAPLGNNQWMNGRDVSVVGRQLIFDGFTSLNEIWRQSARVSAAGLLGVITPMAMLDVKVWDQVMAVNLTANYRLIRSMDPLLRRSDAGRAVFLSSSVAKEPRAFWAAYAVSKAGLEAMARIYADETEHTPVRVAVINPGPMRTRMRAQAFPGEDPMTLPEPHEIVPLILENVMPRAQPSGEVVNFKDWRAGRAAT